MKIQITGRNVTVPDDVVEYANEKIGKLDKYFHNIMDAQVIFSEQKTKRVCEVTIHASGKIIRAENKGTEYKESIDIVAEKLERQIRRYKEKFQTRKKEQTPELEHIEEEDFEAPKIVRVKEVAVKQMMYDEAIMQMELLSHDFFVFYNTENDRINVLYKRNDGDYGVLEPVRA
ncbi:MAG TPA: ribosome-associated translation inhibitor RaiA [Caldisericia bacterium]|nr:ribosome-associated translation inhibitor RaiA [Caldisericia bacterium]HPF48088.1 ribosome-associated translation inhibitor RaiA [Caldisericia bacterium]HPI83975.1 ribosome-associated translation inhibitor RaiA [Caldisericia bacterium]HPQ92541.1 ribosome-associated translation inhibitor RaiA [Caldisericia bacterium]HRV74361.1 ribosome-associated translation inhibitor RaiA [Caldisericia bacterium]